MTPQVITETLWCLTQEDGLRQPVDEIRVITTLAGRDRVVRSLLDSKKGKFHAFCSDYGIERGTIRFDEGCISLLTAPGGETLADIRTRAHNEAAADQITAIVRDLTADPGTVLHASVAGGRKTMGVFLAAAMQLFGRADDRLSHVLVSEDFESHPDFYYPPPKPRRLTMRKSGKPARTVSTASAAVHLARIPFIRVRGFAADLLANAGASYGELVGQAQADLNLIDEECDVRVDVRTRSVTVLGRTAKLTPRELFVYVLYASYRKGGRGRDGAVSVHDITVEDIDSAFEIIAGRHGMTVEAALEFVPGFGFLEGVRRDVAVSDLKSLPEQFRQIRSKIARSLDAARIPDRFALSKDGDAYVIRVPGARLQV